jgi:phage host-nuclease inhibitor protein Gam
MEVPVPKKPTRSKKKVVIPTTLGEVEDLERALTAKLLETKRIEDEAAAKIAEISGEATIKVGTLVAEAVEISRQIFAYADMHKHALTEGGKVTQTELGQGATVQWATMPAVVTIADASIVIGHLKRLGLDRFIRKSKEEVNKEALLDEENTALTVPGVSIDRATKFYLRPANTTARVECSLSSKRWKVVWPEESEKPE